MFGCGDEALHSSQRLDRGPAGRGCKQLSRLPPDSASDGRVLCLRLAAQWAQRHQLLGGAARPGSVLGTQTPTLNTAAATTYRVLITLLLCHEGLVGRDEGIESSGWITDQCKI